MFTLRPYQEASVQAIWHHVRERDDNPCVVIPTGGGKTPVMASLCKDAVTRWGGRVLILAHVKELLLQTVDKLQAICPEVKVGMYSAGLKRRDTDEPVIVAGIQSVYKRACDLDAFNLVIIDEAHLIPPDGDGMYRSFLEDAYIINPGLRVIGLTATPYRMKSGLICEPDNILNHVCYEIGVRELINKGYLSPLTSKAGRVKVDTNNLQIRGGEYVSSEMQSLMDQDELVQAACDEIMDYTHDRKACLVFATGIQHGRHIADELKERHGAEVRTVFGDTPAEEREQALDEFRDGKLKYLVNMSVLTTGFDSPNIDCVALVRPTLSPGLYYQMVGRGFRTHPNKDNCLVLDFGGNILRHGPVDMIHINSRKKNGNGMAPAKECPECHSVIAAGYARCPDCGYEFPKPKKNKHEAKATSAPILSTQVTTTEYKVQDIQYYVHTKFGSDPEDPKTMRVEYRVGWNQFHKEWICFEHTGRAREKAVAWWKSRSNAMVPETADEAVLYAEYDALAHTHSITIRRTAGDKYDRIVDHELGVIPFWREPGWDDVEERDETLEVTLSLTDEEIPF